MKKINLIILIFSLSISYSQDNLSDKYAESITSQELTDLVYLMKLKEEIQVMLDKNEQLTL